MLTQRKIFIINYFLVLIIFTFFTFPSTAICQNIKFPKTSPNTAIIPLESYPNPSTGMINFTQSYTGIINVYDISGKLVYRNYIIILNRLNLNFLQSGVYVIYLKTSNSVFVKLQTIIK